MKVCPKCNTSFTNDALTNCPDDDTELISDASVMENAEAGPVAAKAPEKPAEKSKKVEQKKAAATSAGGSKKRSFIIAAGLLIAIAGGGYWVLTRPRPSTPTETYKGLYAAVKGKNTEEIKKWMSKGTIGFAEAVAKQQNKPIESVFENGFTATTFAASMPKMRDERINENMGALEVWNGKDQRWEDLPFIKEEDGWKLAIGDLFGGTYVSPGKGQDAKEREEANKMTNNAPQIPQGNFNAVNNMKPGKNPVPMPAMPKNGTFMKQNSNIPVNK
jgi:hypothetical protein